MIAKIKENLQHIIILDVSKVYANIYDQGYFLEKEANKIREKYADSEHWAVIVLDKSMLTTHPPKRMEEYYLLQNRMY